MTTRSLVPRPRVVAPGVGAITWTTPLRVDVDEAWRDVVTSFADDLRVALGWDVVIGAGDDAQIVVRRVADLAPEEFQLVVDDQTVIEASTATGVAHALTVLRQMGPAALWSVEPRTLASIELDRAKVHDVPAFGWRGVHLDVARHFWNVDAVCRLIDLAAAHRLNRLHLHLNDDQGWRVEVPGWPRLTEVGAWRASSPLGHEEDGRDDHAPHGGYYSAADLERIRAHAARRFVVIVPEIDLPGHAQAVLAGYPELGNGAAPVEVWTRWGISEHVLNPGEGALAFAEEVVTYVASLFPESPVHIGGDECPTAEWERSQAARAIMEANGFVEARQLQGLFTQRLSRALALAGHEVVAWDEVLDATVPDGTLIAAWRDSAKGVEAAERGLDVVMAPMQSLYFDWLNSSEPGEPVAQARQPFVTPWEKVYGFAVVPPGLDPELHHHVRGAQAQLWTEYIATRDHLDYMAFPRLAAFAEVVWGTATTAADFRVRLEEHLERLTAMGVRYRPLDPPSPEQHVLDHV